MRRFALGEEPSDDLVRNTTPEQRMAMVWALTLEAWAVAGLPISVGRIQDLPARVWRDGRTE